MKFLTTRPKENLLLTFVAILIIAWSTQNFWKNIRILFAHEEKLWANGSSLGFVWLAFVFFLVIIPFLLGVFLLWKSFSHNRSSQLSKSDQ